MVQIDPTRLEQIQALSLSAGSHEEFERGMCVMEAVSYIAGEPWSDAPSCACPVITAFMVAWNDGLPDNASRDRLLKPLIPQIVGTRSTPAIEQRRATMAADWLIRVHTPAWLRLAKLETHAAALEALPEITDFAQCPGLMPTLKAARTDAAAAKGAAWAAAKGAAWAAAKGASWAAAKDAAKDAAWAAAGAAAAKGASWAAAKDAAKDAAWAAAWDAAWDAAWAAAGAAAKDVAWDVAGAAAWDAAWDAAWAAAKDAAWDALKATIEQLQASAAALVVRMIEVAGDF